VKLISPSGTSVTLVDHLPKQLASQIGRVQTLCHARLDDQASTPLREASAPAGYVRGVYRPDATRRLRRRGSNRVWTLSVTDTIADDPKIIGSDPVGSVRDWSIAIATDEGDEPATELIHGWYDATGRFDGSWVPPGWRPPAAPETASALYLDTVRLNCRTCHLQQTDRLDALDFSTWEKFASFRERIRYLVFDAGVMPVARRTCQVFWLAEHPSASAALAAFAGATRGPGRPVASAGSDRSVEIGTAVRLDAGEASSPPSTVALRRAARGSEAVLQDAASATPTFTPDVPGAFRVLLVVGDGALRSESAAVTITATVSSARKSFTKDVVPLLVDCRSCHARDRTGPLPTRRPRDPLLRDGVRAEHLRTADAACESARSALEPRLAEALEVGQPRRRSPAGLRSRRDHSRYDIIRQWIEQSAPDVPVND
jgi:hypothetical protein